MSEIRRKVFERLADNPLYLAALLRDGVLKHADRDKARTIAFDLLDYLKSKYPNEILATVILSTSLATLSLLTVCAQDVEKIEQAIMRDLPSKNREE
jgi:hypothetical protein